MGDGHTRAQGARDRRARDGRQAPAAGEGTGASPTPITDRNTRRCCSPGAASRPGSRYRWHRSASSHDNAVCESFHASLKKELIHRRPWPTRAEARKAKSSSTSRVGTTRGGGTPRSVTSHPPTTSGSTDSKALHARSQPCDTHQGAGGARRRQPLAPARPGARLRSRQPAACLPTVPSHPGPVPSKPVKSTRVHQTGGGSEGRYRPGLVPSGAVRAMACSLSSGSACS